LTFCVWLFLGGQDQLTSQNTESMHEKLERHIDRTAATQAAVMEALPRLLRLEELSGISDTSSALDTQEVSAKKKSELFRK